MSKYGREDTNPPARRRRICGNSSVCSLDLFGMLKNVAYRPRPAGKPWTTTAFACSAAPPSRGALLRIDESDMCLYPRPGCFEIFPGGGWQVSSALDLCDVCSVDQARCVLKRAMERAEGSDAMFNVGPEVRDFSCSTPTGGAVPTTQTHETAGYLARLHRPGSGGTLAQDIVYVNLEDMGLRGGASHHGLAPAQHGSILSTRTCGYHADNIMTLKISGKTIASAGLHATQHAPSWGRQQLQPHQHVQDAARAVRLCG